MDLTQYLYACFLVKLGKRSNIFCQHIGEEIKDSGAKVMYNENGQILVMKHWSKSTPMQGIVKKNTNGC